MTISAMDKYKDKFKVYFAQAMQKNLSRWKRFQNHYRIQLITSDLIWYFIAFALGFIPGERERHYDIHFHLVMALVLLIIAIVYCIQHENKQYQNEVKSTFFFKLLKIFGNDVYYKGKTVSKTQLASIISKTKNEKYSFDDFEKEYRNTIYEKRVINNMFNTCELLNKRVKYREDDECIWGTYNNTEFIINETTLYCEKYDEYELKKIFGRIFKGTAMQFTINKNIESRILIFSKSLKNNIPKGYEKVNLEYEKFNKKYNVYAPVGTKGQIDARYLFNTAFLDRFMQIQTSFKIKKMQCSIKGNTILMLLTTNRDLFEMNHLFGRIDDVNQYSTLFDEFASVLSFIDVLNLSSKTRL